MGTEICPVLLYLLHLLLHLALLILLSGGGKRDRTADLLHAMQALSQLSYTPGAEQKREYSKGFAAV